MPDPMCLLSRVTISRDEWLSFLSSHHIPDAEDGVYDGQLVEGQQNVWVLLKSAEQLHIYLSDCSADEIERMTTKLGGPPKSSILVDVGKYPTRSDKLALTFVSACGKQWPCIVDTLEPGPSLYSIEELEKLL